MLNFAKFSSGLTVVAATGFLIGAMLTDNGSVASRGDLSDKFSRAKLAEELPVVDEQGIRGTAIDEIITTSIERVKRSESKEATLDELIINGDNEIAKSINPVKPEKVASVSTPVSGGMVVVQAGDTLYRIGVRNGLSIAQIAEMNGISEPYTVRVGQKLRVSN